MHREARIYRNSVVYKLYSSDANVYYKLHCSENHVFSMTPEEWEKLPKA